MTYGIRIVGLKEAQRLLGVDLKPAIQAATKAIALEVQGEIAPYPPIVSHSGRRSWYERGYGPKWMTKAGVHGRPTSQTLGRRFGLLGALPAVGKGGWALVAKGSMGHVLGNSATYAGLVHSKERQARVHARHGWVTDEQAMRQVIASGAVKRIVTQAIMARLRRR